MKLVLQILAHIVYCTFLPLSIVLFTVMTMPLCFPEGYGTNDYILHFCIGCLPSWLFAAMGYFGWRWKIITTYFARKMLMGHALTVLIIGSVAFLFATMTKVSKVNLLIVLLITLCCLAPRILMHIINQIQKHKNAR